MEFKNTGPKAVAAMYVSMRGRMIKKLGTLYLSLIPESHSNHTVLAWWMKVVHCIVKKSTLMFFQKIDGLDSTWYTNSF
jgi:hypothetical protein